MNSASAGGNPVILADASRLLGSDRPDIGIVFPTMTIAKVIAVQLMLG